MISDNEGKRVRVRTALRDDHRSHRGSGGQERFIAIGHRHLRGQQIRHPGKHRQKTREGRHQKRSQVRGPVRIGRLLPPSGRRTEHGPRGEQHASDHVRKTEAEMSQTSQKEEKMPEKAKGKKEEVREETKAKEKEEVLQTEKAQMPQAKKEEEEGPLRRQRLRRRVRRRSLLLRRREEADRIPSECDQKRGLS